MGCVIHRPSMRWPLLQFVGKRLNGKICLRHQRPEDLAIHPSAVSPAGAGRMRLLPLVLCVIAASCARGSEPADGVPFILKPVAPDVWEAVPNPGARTLIPSNIGVVAGDDG